MLRPCLPFALLCSCILLPLPAQGGDAGRGRAVGWVVDQAGRRVPDADVVLWSWPLPPRADIGVLDRVDTRTDAEGRFAAALLHGRAYSAHATWRRDGAVHRTALVDGVMPGPPVRLTAAGPQALRTVAVHGSAAWHRHGPLQAVLATANEHPLRVPIAMTGDGALVLPDLPAVPCRLEIRTRRGQLLHVTPPIDLASDAPITAELPPPHPLAIAVRDATGAACAGAQVYQLHGFGYGERDFPPDLLGTTGDDGGLAVELPGAHPVAGPAQRRIDLLVVAPGPRRAVAECLLGSSGTEQLHVQLPEGVRVRGRVLDRSGAPVADLLLLPDAPVPFARGGASIAVPPLPIRTAADGSFVAAGTHEPRGFRLFAAMEPDRAASLGLAVRPDHAVAPLLWLAVGGIARNPVEDLGDLRLDQLTVAQVQVRDHDGAPAPGARLEVRGDGHANAPIEYLTDRVGRLQFPLPRGEMTFGAFVPGGGVAFARVRAPALAQDPPLDPLVLTLTRPVPVGGVVVDGQGQPIAGARVQPWSAPDGGEPGPSSLAFRARLAPVPTDAEGRFALTLPFGDVVQTLSVRVPAADGYREHRLDVAVPAAGASDVRLVLSPAAQPTGR